MSALAPIRSGRSSFGRLVRKAHRSAARSIGYALTQDSEAGWATFTALICMRLSRRERVALAFAVLNALDPADAALTADAALDNLFDQGAPHG